MKKIWLTFFAAFLVLGLVLAMGADVARALPTYTELPTGMDNCATCHNGTVNQKIIPDHSGRSGACTTCHAPAKPEPEPAPAPAPAPAPPAPEPKPAPTPKPAPAAPPYTTKNLNFTLTGVIGESQYTAEGNLDAIVFQERTYLSVRELVEMLGQYVEVAQLSWDGNNKTVKIATLKNNLVIYTTKPALEFNGVELVLELGARIFNDRAYIPVRAFVEGLGGSVSATEDGVGIALPQL